MTTLALSLWLALTPAQAAPAAHYHPDAVARASQAFARAQEASAAPFDTLQATARARAAALQDWKLGLDLLGDRAPDAEQAAYTEARKQFFRDRAVVGAFASDLMSGVDAAFTDALQRALAAAGGDDWPVCTDERPRGLRMAPGPRSAAPAAECPGEDRSAALAAAMDADPALEQALDALLPDAWPAFSATGEPGTATEGAARLDLVAWMRQHAPQALAAIDRDEEQARVPIEARLEQDPSPSELDTLRAQVAAITEGTAARRAALAAPVLDAVDTMASKLAKKGVPAPALCVRPMVYGGCAQPAMAADAEELLVTSGKVRKALAQAAATR